MDQDWGRINAAAGQSIAQGRYADAAALLQQALALRPNHADSWFNLGYVHRQMRAYAAALDAYAEALRRQVTNPEAAHVNRAAILCEYLERPEAAEAELRAALEKNPHFLPAWLNLGGLLEDAGHAEAAADAYYHALEVAPGNGRARARLAAIHVHRGDHDLAIRDLEQQLRIGGDSYDDTAELCFGLGNSLDAVGRYPEAFAAITRANRVNAAMRPPGQRYDRRAQEQLVDALIALYPQRPAGLTTGGGPEIIFICGMFRSGSTVIEQLIGRHRDIQIGGELELIPAMVHDQLQPYPGALRTLDDAAVQRLRDDYLATIMRQFPDAARVTDKRPDNFLHLGLIKTLFPAARIVHTVRNPLDTFLSVYFLNFAATINYSDHLDDIAHYFGQYRRLMAHWQRIFGDDIVTVDYDQLVVTPDAVIAEAVAQLGLDAGTFTTGAADAPTIIRTPSNWKARSAITRQSSGRWRHYADQLASLRDAMAAHLPAATPTVP